MIRLFKKNKLLFVLGISTIICFIIGILFNSFIDDNNKLIEDSKDNPRKEKLVTELTESGAQYCVIDGQYYTEKGETIAILTLDVTRTSTVEPIKETIPTGNWQIQLMASSNIDAINKGWIDLSKKHKSLQNLSHNIESITNDKGSSIYRLKTGNFNSKEEADKFCNNLKKEGLNCITKQK